ncbi:uncharacterized protein [Choristoneura fumiferana]|uniref:uncharacterized protein n=1 Tax=Choristoneura fumiferana TaxID=7141 RepID=UPI003D15848E
MDHLTQLQRSMEDMKAMFASRMAAFEGARDAPVSTDAGAAALTSDDYQSFKAFIWSAVEGLQVQMGLVLKALEEQEMRSRSSMLLLHGAPESDREETLGLVLRMCQRDLQMTEVVAGSFNSCHRLGRGRGTSGPRPILVKFASQQLRDAVWSAKKKLKGTKLTLTEFLTAARHATFLEARRIFGVRNSWTSSGRIVVQYSDRRRQRVTSLAELHELPPPDMPAGDFATDSEGEAAGPTTVPPVDSATNSGTGAPGARGAVSPSGPAASKVVPELRPRAPRVAAKNVRKQ